MLSPTETSLCETIAARSSGLRDQLAEHVGIPTGHNHTPGLDRYRELVTSRLRAIGAAVELLPGQPRPAWLRVGPPATTAAAPVVRANGAAGGGEGSAGREGLGGAPAHFPAKPEAPIPPTAVCRREVPGKPRILIVGHLDTVFDPAGPFQAMAVSPDGRTATGPGVVDMKGGILIALTALEALAERGVEVNWTFALNSDEETGSFHSEQALHDLAKSHDVGLVLEPALPDGSLVIERKGSGQFMIEVFGKSAHVGREFNKGVSAVYALGAVLTNLAGMSDVQRGVTVNVGPIIGGNATNVVPDHAAAWGNVRYQGRETADELARRLDALATAEDSLPRIVVRRTFNRPAKPQTPGVRRLALAARAAAESLGQKLPFASTGGVCDGNILQNAGLPTIDTLGVRGGGLHTHQEWIELASLLERAQLFAILLSRLTDGTAYQGTD